MTKKFLKINRKNFEKRVPAETTIEEIEKEIKNYFKTTIEAKEYIDNRGNYNLEFFYKKINKNMEYLYKTSNLIMNYQK